MLFDVKNRFKKSLLFLIIPTLAFQLTLPAVPISNFFLAPQTTQQLEETFELGNLTAEHLELIDAVLGNLKVGDKLWGRRIQSFGRENGADYFVLEKTGSRLEIKLDLEGKRAVSQVRAATTNDLDRLSKASRQILGVIPEESTNAPILRKIFDELAHRKVQDQYVEPVADVTYPGLTPPGQEKPAIFLWFNTRTDRSIIMARVFTEEGFQDFPFDEEGVFATYVGMKPHVKTVTHAAYPGSKVKNHITEVLSRAGIPVLKVAEDQKRAHVTEFFNGGKKEPYPGESRRILPSPKPDKEKKETMAHFPRMSAGDTTPLVLAGMSSRNVVAPTDKVDVSTDGPPLTNLNQNYAGEGFPLIVVNFANPDQVGHEGNFEAVVEAVATVDEKLGEIMKKADEEDYIVISVADHGNAEEMLTARGKPSTKHSIRNPVNFSIYDPLFQNNGGDPKQFLKTDQELEMEASLANIAPTILELMGQPIPAEMTPSLLKNYPHLFDKKGKKRKVVLVIKDGWGEAPHGPGNAVTEASRRKLTPHTDKLLSQFPNRNILPYGTHVGAQAGKMGDSDKGHMVIGAGRVEENLLLKIDREIENGQFFKNPVLVEAMEEAVKTGVDLHLKGLLSDEGVHADHYHLFALLEMAAQRGVKNIWVHPLLDGRDSDIGTGLYYLLQLETKIQELEASNPGMKIRIGIIGGREFGMARGTDFQLARRAFVPLRHGFGILFTREAAHQLLEAYTAETEPGRKKLIAERIQYFIGRLNKIKMALLDLGGVLSAVPASLVVQKFLGNLVLIHSPDITKNLKKTDLERILFSGRWARELRESTHPSDIVTTATKTLSFPDYVEVANAQFLKSIFLSSKEAQKKLGPDLLKKLNDTEEKDRAAFVAAVKEALAVLEIEISDEKLIPETVFHDILYRSHPATKGAPETVQNLQKNGFKTRILTNHFPDSSSGFKPNEIQMEWLKVVFGEETFHKDHVYFSNQLGIAKPKKNPFKVVNTVEAVEPEEVAYVDDQAANTDVGVALGYLTSHFVAGENGASLDQDFILNELVTGEWRQMAQAALQESQGGLAEFTPEAAEDLLKTYILETDPEKKKEIGEKIRYWKGRLDRVKGVLLDIGGVLCDDRKVTTVFEILRQQIQALCKIELSDEQVENLFFTGEAIQKYRRSKISLSSYINETNDSLRLISMAKFGAGFLFTPLEVDFFNTFLYLALPGAKEAVESTRKTGLRTLILSNGSKKAALLRRLIQIDFGDENFAPNQIYLSSETGYEKPQRAAFQNVEKTENLNPDELLYIDDQPENVRWAKTFGYLTSQHKSTEANPLTKNFLMQELATGEWRKKAELVLGSSTYLRELPDSVFPDTPFLVRGDFNVPFNKVGEEIRVKDPTRVLEEIPTIQYIRDRGGIVILVSHWEKEDGGDKIAPSLAPIATILREKGISSQLIPDVYGPEVEAALAKAKPGDVFLLENTRLKHAKAEKGKDKEKNEEMARGLARLARVFVFDGFGSGHRGEHASVGVVAKYIVEAGGIAVKGPLVEKEERGLAPALVPSQPVVAIFGGSKISGDEGKLKILKKTLSKLSEGDTLVIGGLMANAFLVAAGKGEEIKASPFQAVDVPLAAEVLDVARRRGVTVILPEPVDCAFFDRKIFDVGPQMVQAVEKALEKARTVIWNGPVGKFEEAPFDLGTLGIARAIAKATKERNVISILGGGDTLKAVKGSEFKGAFTFVSTGGGAMLKYLEEDGQLSAFKHLTRPDRLPELLQNLSPLSSKAVNCSL